MTEKYRLYVRFGSNFRPKVLKNKIELVERYAHKPYRSCAQGFGIVEVEFGFNKSSDMRESINNLIKLSKKEKMDLYIDSLVLSKEFSSFKGV